MKFTPLLKKHPENTIIGTITINNSTNIDILGNKELLKMFRGLYNNAIDTVGLEYFHHVKGCDPQRQVRIFNLKHIIKVMRAY